MSKEKRKKCFWRHGDFKTVKIREYLYDGTKNQEDAYKVKRWIAIQKCGFCGKIIMETSNK